MRIHSTANSGSIHAYVHTIINRLILRFPLDQVLCMKRFLKCTLIN